jgi:charged multivesicular body protein 5
LWPDRPTPPTFLPNKAPLPVSNQTIPNDKKSSLNSLDEQIKKLDEQLARFRDQLKRARPGTAAHEAVKRRALAVLRQKRMYEGQRDTLHAQQLNVEQARFAVESIQDTAQTVQALRGGVAAGRAALGASKGQLDLGAIDRLQDEMAEMADLSTEINEAIGQSYAVPDGVDEADLMAELDALEDDMAFGEGAAGERAGGGALGAGGVPSYLADEGGGLDAEAQEFGLPAAPAGQAAPALPT